MREILQRGNRTEYSYAVIASCPSDRSLAGKTVPQAAKLKRGNDSIEDQIELILQIQRDGGASAIFHGIHEDDLRVFFQHPLTMIASDGGPKDLRDAVTHPRSFGNNARVLGQYVRVLKLLTLEEAIRKMTSLPAQTFRLKDRGVLKPGAWADVVVFNPDTVADKSTFDDPIHFSEGFSQVLVRGVPVLRDGEMTGQTPGGSLKFEP
jgi:N-acyl-D-amino-acid deacylase